MVVRVKQMNSFDCEDDICNGCYALFCLGGVILRLRAEKNKNLSIHPLQKDIRELFFTQSEKPVSAMRPTIFERNVLLEAKVQNNSTNKAFLRH